MKEKIILYQVFTRLFGNTNTTRVERGTLAQNGCGKMANFTAKALGEIKKLGTTHLWYTGVIEHATQTSYAAYGIAQDHAAVVKGRAGSPYAIKDYYDIDPDLANEVSNRMKEFQLLVNRTHKAGLKMIIDFVPNHVARQYGSDAKPAGVADLGEGDERGHAFNPANNFYYIPNEAFKASFDLQQGEPAPYHEFPAKATGNDNFSAWAGVNDWYETIKLNYGIDYCAGGHRCFDPIPNTWVKMREILLFWAAKKIDGFRCDMAEMVPAEFWGWVIPQVKAHYPEIIFIAEVYNPNEYRHYIFNGKFDYLYDKVGLYDTLRGVMTGMTSATAITHCWQAVDDIKSHMLNFLENHDEQRIASDFFAGDAQKGKPALLTSTLMGRNPMMIYFGQELGERGMDKEGFSGQDGRTTIFDYWSVDTLTRWFAGGKFTGKQLTAEESELQAYYRRVLQLCHSEKAIAEGEFYDLMYVNPWSEQFDNNRQYAFLRSCEGELLLVVANFSGENRPVEVKIPPHAFEYLGIETQEQANFVDLLSDKCYAQPLSAATPIRLELPSWGGVILKLTVH